MSSTPSETLRRKFTQEEDNKLRELVKEIGAKKWIEIAKSMPGRTGRQCRDRFQNYLSPILTNGPWTKEDDHLLLQKVIELGSTWSKIVTYFPGRSTNNVKNRYNIHLAKYERDIESFKRLNGFRIEPSEKTTVSIFGDTSVWDLFKPEDQLTAADPLAPMELFFENISADAYASLT